MRLGIPIVLASALAAVSAQGRTLDPATLAANASNAALKAGFQQYDALDFEPALASFKAALEDPKLAPAEQAAAALWAGMIAQSLNDVGGAKSLFDRALQALPDLELPTDAPPKTQLAFAEVKRTRRLTQPPAGEDLSDLADSDAQAASVDSESSGGRKMWLLAGAGVVAVGAAVVAILLLTGEEKPAGCGGGGKGCLDVTVPALRWSGP